MGSIGGVGGPLQNVLAPVIHGDLRIAGGR